MRPAPTSTRRCQRPLHHRQPQRPGVASTNVVAAHHRTTGGLRMLPRCPARAAWAWCLLPPQRLSLRHRRHRSGYVAVFRARRRLRDVLHSARRGCRTGMKLEFTRKSVARIRRSYGLKCRYDRLREAGMLTTIEIAHHLGITRTTVGIWKRHGLLLAHPYNDKNRCLYEPVGDGGPSKQQGTKLSERRRFPEVRSHAANEVHHEA